MLSGTGALGASGASGPGGKYRRYALRVRSVCAGGYNENSTQSDPARSRFPRGSPRFRRLSEFGTQNFLAKSRIKVGLSILGSSVNDFTQTISRHCMGLFLWAFSLPTAAAIALEARILPENPQLGDTLSAIVETDSADAANPTLSVNGQVYPTYRVGTNRFRGFIPTTPLESPGGRTVEVSGEGQVKMLTVQVDDRDFPIQEIWLSEEVNAIQGTDYEFDRVEEFRSLTTPEQLWNGIFLQPVDGWISTVYGVRRYYNGEWAENYYHRGLDYAAGMGEPVFAAADGRISLVGRVSEGFELHGNSIGIDHGQGVTTMYIHLSEIDVREGQMVRAGDIVGRVGSTGISTGPHLHWGLYVHGESVDPIPWLERGLK